MSGKIHRFLVISGAVLLVVGFIRFYRVVREHASDPVFAPHLLGASLSVWIAYSLFNSGLKKRELNKKGAISLIRSGSVLLAIWGYRLVLFLKSGSVAALTLQAVLAPFYVVVGTIVMCLGLKVSRGLRRQAREKALAFSNELTLPLVEEPTRK